jgi:polyferredoxin
MTPRTIQRSTHSSGQTIRFWVQAGFLLLCLWIGVEFSLWYAHKAGWSSYMVTRPPGVEGFLPISSLLSIAYWVMSGEFNLVHPAGTVILVAIIAISLVFKKSFCSWFCPLGTISENLGEFGKKLFKRNYKVWKWLDYPLRSLKYLMLGFLLWVVLFQMDSVSMKMFLGSPYNKVADVKMLLFFKEISRTSIIVLSILVISSLFVRNFWCRYLCPYGGFLGIIGLLSPFRITRNAFSCIDCAKCTKVCPSSIKVDTLSVVMSDECTSCLACVDACPVKDTLQYKVSRKAKAELRSGYLAAALIAIFVLITGIAMLTGNWKSSVSEEEFSRRIQDIDNPIYQHQQGNAPQEEAAETSPSH